MFTLYTLSDMDLRYVNLYRHCLNNCTKIITLTILNYVIKWIQINRITKEEKLLSTNLYLKLANKDNISMLLLQK